MESLLKLFSLPLHSPSNLSKTVWKMHPKRAFHEFSKRPFLFEWKEWLRDAIFLSPAEANNRYERFSSSGYFYRKIKFFRNLSEKSFLALAKRPTFEVLIYVFRVMPLIRTQINLKSSSEILISIPILWDLASNSKFTLK